MIPISLLKISTEVQEALQSGKPVVALESTIIAHGMPWPVNVETARDVERLVRKQGAIPATIAILKGQVCVGLSEDQLQKLGQSKDVWKVSTRDIAFVISRGLDGATTVASTLRIAELCGIRIFVTGGIGGVHRGAQSSMDVSADLLQMTQSSLGVVSAGVKSILDVGLTLEKLEMLGVPVVTMGSDNFPSFYSRESGFRSPLRLDLTEEIAAMLKVKWQMGLDGSVLIAIPIPVESEIPHDVIEKFILEAMQTAVQNGIQGKDLTPFLLKEIAGKTGGRSLAANIALVKNNAVMGGRIAKILSEISDY